MEWAAQVTEVQPRRTWQFSLHRSDADIDDATALTYVEVLDLWSSDADFTKWFNELLAQQSPKAFRFETPPVTSGSLDQTFEFVLVDSPALLGTQADVAPFAHPLADGDQTQSVIAFPNLRGDAQMIVPRPQADDSAYAHLAEFVRRAPLEQRRKLWQTVAKAVRSMIGDSPLWLSTAGLGVSWLHVRLDSRPKYYSHRPYAVAIR